MDLRGSGRRLVMSNGCFRIAARTRSAAAVASVNAERRFLIGGVSVNLSGSVGVTFDPDCSTPLDRLMQEADAGLYEAKSAGGRAHLASASAPPAHGLARPGAAPLSGLAMI